MSTLLQFTSAAGSWDSHFFVPNEQLTADGHYVEYVVTELVNGVGYGISAAGDGSLNNTYMFWFSSLPYILLNGGVVTSFPARTINLFDRIRFRKLGSNVIVSHNGEDFYTIALAGPLYAWAGSYNGSASVDIDSVNGVGVTTKASAACTITLGPATYDTFADSPNILFSKHTFLGSGRFRETNCQTSGIKFKFTGPEAWAIFSARRQVALTSTLRSWVSYRIDGGAWTRSKITDESLLSIKIASGLSAGLHEAEFQVSDSYYGGLWNTDAALRYSSIDFYGARLPNGSVISPSSAKSRSILWWGDSNSMGAENEYPNSNAQLAFPALVAQAVGADLSLFAYPGQGWITTAGSNVPTFQNGWNLMYNDASRLVGGKITPDPDVVAICHGQNDAFDVTSAATSTINAILAATTKAKVAIVCPVGRSRRSELQAAVAAVANPRCVFIDNPTNLLAIYGANGGSTHLTTAGDVAAANIYAPQFAALFPASSFRKRSIDRLFQPALRSPLT